MATNLIAIHMRCFYSTVGSRIGLGEIISSCGGLAFFVLILLILLHFKCHVLRWLLFKMAEKKIIWSGARDASPEQRSKLPGGNHAAGLDLPLRNNNTWWSLVKQHRTWPCFVLCAFSQTTNSWTPAKPSLCGFDRRNLGFKLNQNLSFDSHIKHIKPSCLNFIHCLTLLTSNLITGMTCFWLFFFFFKPSKLPVF